MMAKNQTQQRDEPEYIKKANFADLRFTEIHDWTEDDSIKKAAINAFFDPEIDHDRAWHSYLVALKNVPGLQFKPRSAVIKEFEALYGNKRESVLQIINEIAVLQKIKHDSIVYLKRNELTLDHVAIVIPLYNRGTVEDYITRKQPTQEGINIVSFTESMESALKLIHSQGVIHNDIHPGNIMLKDDGSPVLIDFGLAHVLCKSSGECVACCTPMTNEDVNRNTLRYKPPHLQKVCSTQIDVWAMAMVVLEVGSKTSWSALLDTCPERPFGWNEILKAQCIRKFLTGAVETWPDVTEAESIFHTRAEYVTHILSPLASIPLESPLESRSESNTCIKSWPKYSVTIEDSSDDSWWDDSNDSTDDSAIH